jgi:hypothetical protein
MKKCSLTIVLLWFLAFSLSGTGCSATRSNDRKEAILESSAADLETDQESTGKVALKKRIMVLPLVDKAGFGKANSSEIGSEIVKRFEASNALTVYLPQRVAVWPLQGPLTRLGIICCPALIKKGAESGMQALVTGVIDINESGVKRKGIWPFRKSFNVYEASMVINVVDVLNGTLLLTKRDSEQLLVDKDEAPQNKKTLFEQVMKETFQPVIERLTSTVIEKIEQKPWAASIVAVDDESVTINAGKDIGVRVGLLFDVFAKGPKINTYSGNSYYLLGKKVGTVKVTSIMETCSLATPSSGEGKFTPGQAVMIVTN